MEASGSQNTRNCVSCGKSIAWDANVCQYCGHDYRAQMAGPPKKEKGVISLVGGVMILIAGIMGLFMGAMFLAVNSIDFGSYGLDVAGLSDTLHNILTVCGVIFIVLGLVALLGGFFGIQRKHFGLVILGGVLGLFTLGPYMLGSILALVGLILVAVAKGDFE